MTPGVCRVGLAVLVPAIAATVYAGSAVTPSASVTTAVQGWEHYFRLDWTAEPRSQGTDVEGYVYNNYGRPAGRVQLLAQALDAANNVVAQKLEWVPGEVPPLSRSYFKISSLPRADHYRVTVWAFDFIDAPDFRRRRF